MQPIRTVLKLSLVAATLALPIWGAFGFMLAGLMVGIVGCAWLIVGPIVRD